MELHTREFLFGIADFDAICQNVLYAVPIGKPISTRSLYISWKPPVPDTNLVKSLRYHIHIKRPTGWFVNPSDLCDIYEIDVS